jgi:hypothetical protein
LASFFYISRPILLYTQSLKVVLTYKIDPVTNNSVLAIAKELGDTTNLLEGYNTELHLLVEAQHMIEQQCFNKGLCKLFCKQMSGLVTTLSFYNNGDFGLDSYLCKEDNKEQKLSELYKFFVVLLPQFPCLREVLGR